VDLPEDGSNSTFNGRDGKVDGTNDNSIVNASKCVSAVAASAQSTSSDDDESTFAQETKDILRVFQQTATTGMTSFSGSMEATRTYIAKSSDNMHNMLIEMDEHTNARLAPFCDMVGDTLRQMEAVLNQNTALRVAYDAWREETAALKAAVDALTWTLDQHIAIPAPPSPDLTASSTTMEEMTMQLSVIQHDIQDVLEAVRNPPGKRKRRTSNQDTEPTTPTNRRPATNRQRAASPEHSLMHSQHATSATQDALDALMIKYPPCPLAITSTEATTDPLPDSPAVQDTSLPDAPTTTAPAENDGWKTVEGKGTQLKRRNDKADNKWAATTANNTPTTKNGGRGKNTHQPRTNTPSTKKTWAEVIKSGGINVQIVLGNSNVGLTTPTARRGERWGGAARRLGKKAGGGERGEEGRGMGGPKMTGGDGICTKGSGGERGVESGAEVAQRRYNLSFVAEEIKAEKCVTMEGEERRTEGNPARWPLSKTGLLADTSQYGPQIQKNKGRTDLKTEDKLRKPM
jgi:hypothetical protein